MTRKRSPIALPAGVEIQVMEQHQLEDVVPLWLALDKHVYEQVEDYTRLKKSRNYSTYIKKWLKQNLFDNNATVLVASTEHKIIGFVTAQIQTLAWYAAKQQGFIGPLYVTPHYRRKGVAAGLVHALENWFVKQEIKYVDVIWDQGNSAAERFWSKMGYEPIQIRASKKL